MITTSRHAPKVYCSVLVKSTLVTDEIEVTKRLMDGQRRRQYTRFCSKL